jgi:hypothetical protein
MKNNFALLAEVHIAQQAAQDLIVFVCRNGTVSLPVHWYATTVQSVFADTLWLNCIKVFVSSLVTNEITCNLWRISFIQQETLH